MLAGTNNIGCSRPTTPGSSSPGEDRTGIAAGMSTGELWRTASRTRSQKRRRVITTARNPHSHTARIAQAQFTEYAGAACVARTTLGKGSETCSIVAATVCVALLWTGCDHSSRLPKFISAENGTKNLSDAHSHSQYRTRAWFLRKANDSSAAAAANSVDCHT